MNIKRLSPAQDEKIATIIAKVDAVGRADAKTYATRQTYADWTRRFCTYLCLHAPDEVKASTATPAEKIRAFQIWLAAGLDNGKKKSATSLWQARHALLFFYQSVQRVQVGDIGLIPSAVRPKLLPDVRSPEEVERVINATQDSERIPYRLILLLLYYTGARINDVLRLRLADINWRDSEVMFRCGKGKKDGIGKLPCVIVPALRRQVERARWLWQRDRDNRVPVQLPDPVYNKSANYGFSEGWYFLFPAPNVGFNKDHQINNRWHVDPADLQRAVRKAATKVGLDGVLTPHKLRHVYATELLRDGVDIRTVQELLRHEDVKTTEIYAHTAVRAPSTVAAIERHALRVQLATA
jgi:site-specific recombinase XerD